MTLERLYKNFDVLENWQDRYRFIIELGGKIPALPESAKVEENRVHGCTSTVHMTVQKIDGASPRFDFIANSDASIVNGLIAILQIVYAKKTVEEMKAIDIKSIFHKLGLDNHLSPNRRNGFFSMVERLQTLSHSALN